MFFNKNGLKINLTFPNSLNEKEISELESKKVNKNLIRQESAIFFSKTAKSVEINIKKEKPKLLRKSSYNFPIISKLKICKDFIINRTSKFDILKPIKPKETKNNVFEIIKLDNINIIIPKKIIETELNKDIKPESKLEQPIIHKKLFDDLKSFNSNNIFIQGNKKNKIIEIQNKINEIELLGKAKLKTFGSIDIVYKVNDLTIEKTEKTEIIKGDKIIPKKIELKSINTDNIEIKPNINPKEQNNSIEKNIISFLISGTSKIKEEKIISMQSNIINFQIINKSKSSKRYKFENLTKINNINFDIKHKKKKSPRLILRKVDGFGNVSNKLFINRDKINNKEIVQNKDEDENIIKKIDNKGGIHSKIDKFKTKSPNHIQIKINNNNQDNNINLNFNENNTNNNKTQKNLNSNKESKNAITINTINNEIIYNKQTFDFPVINTELINLEEQYEKIKKDLNDLYPMFYKNKKYRENFFLQLSQGNHEKYNFYTNLYKIIKDEQDEKKNNHMSNYLKMKKIIGNTNTMTLSKSKNKLKPLKKNKSSHYIFAKDKIFPLNTES